MASEALEPWRDPENYKSGKRVRCYGCKTECHKAHWGNWCFDCNVERIDRINKRFAELVK
ncbi:hypothetical protein FXV83_16665 [Bradyrhizobium hipponense]|uniref:Uncharacterized protein n=1 Tax=Bradyrhizobium hipponense TaxID=2605638 RepID=A0A5S4YNH5_9BRAD|nr:hypothetical protein [Bradyrhizobium hipponense]TYO65563.1 hypothetical protein FXV83_16665 [Bradyrhizobium hipponense]